MNEVLQANIFFVIASLATVVFCILISIILYQVIKILGVLQIIIKRIEAGSDLVAQDVAHVREFVANGGMFAKVVQFMMGRKHSRTRSKKSEE